MAALTAALSLSLGSGAYASVTGSSITPSTEIQTSAPSAAENPFLGIDLDGLRAEQLTMWPAGKPVKYWALTLNDDLASKTYTGGVFFLYAPAAEKLGYLLDTDIIVRSVEDPHQVVVTDLEFLRANPRAEIRYGNPEKPALGRVIATATTWM
ncbi:hypothetical protein ACODT3_41750 [Streptomyces sp. 4.24]|uniref:hypothetical protein n=1 Tax=Streptomyces tritrimontium TaxID=3406573 RepID=UPI003BB799ED